MESLLKQGGGGGHIAVGVKLPSGTLQRPISQEDIYIRPPGMIKNTLDAVTVNTKSRILLQY